MEWDGIDWNGRVSSFFTFIKALPRKGLSLMCFSITAGEVKVGLASIRIRRDDEN